MKPGPIAPGRLVFDAEGLPASSAYGDIYHPRGGAGAQARQVFLAGCELPGRWQGRDRFVILETGFGLGNNFLAAWSAWREDPDRGERLVFISVEKHPLGLDDLALAHRGNEWPELALRLRVAWPPPTHDLHRLAFDAGRVELLLAFGDVRTWLRELDAEVDAFFLDGFAPARNPEMWDARVCSALGRLAAADARLATWSAAGALRRDLRTAGFDVRRAPGQGGKREITLGRFMPTFAPRRPARRAAARRDERREALIVGAGLAGTSAAWALAEQGWRCTLVERAAGIATAASGNPAGLFHGVTHAADGPHARFGRHAAAHAAQVVRRALAAGVPGEVAGLLRLEHRLDTAAMRSLLDRLGLPPAVVEALDAAEASRRAGLSLRAPAWFYPEGGWVDPAALAAWYVTSSGAALATGADVARLHRDAGLWHLLDRHGRTIGAAPVVLLANAGAAASLIASLDGTPPSTEPPWPLEIRRGQLSVAHLGPRTAVDTLPLPTLPTLPIAGEGYLLPRVGDSLVFGASSQLDDADPSVRRRDSEANLAQLERLLGGPSGLDAADLGGRTAWRCATADRLPLIGGVPDPAAAGLSRGRHDRPRLIARQPGLFVYAALGSRGIGWSALGARIAASAISGAPSPVETSLLDAVDPARFLCRAANRRSTAPEDAP